jgi:tetrathionate reductase subunit A
MNDLKKYSHSKPDFANIEFAIFWGTSPSQAGNPFKRQGRMVARARTKGSLSYVVVEPTQTNASSLAAHKRNNWIPVKPGGDLAMALGMIRWIIENQRYNKAYLEIPGAKGGKANKEALWTNATHLIISDTEHPRFGHFLRASDMGIKQKAVVKAYDKHDAYMVIDTANDKLTPHTDVLAAELFVDQTINTPNGSIKVKSSLQQLKEEAEHLSLEEYSNISKVSVNVLKGLAHEFTSHGRKAATNVHGGMMSTIGFYSTYAILMLNALIGSVNQRGGTTMKGGTYPDYKPGPRYNMLKFPGKVKPKGVFLSRSRFPYEKTSEYKRRVAAGESPYPTKQPWYAFSPPLLNEHFVGAFSGYPYKLKALISHMANPVYGTAGMKAAMEDKLKDPEELPLFIGIDAFINETNVYADYLVPDSVSYECWGWAGVWAGTVTKVSTARWPVVEPAQDKSEKGYPITMELFFIEAAKRMKLPGFGDNAIPDKDGNLHPLNRPEDFYLRAAANVAFAGQAVPDIKDDDIALSGVSRIMPDIEKTLKPEEQRKVAYLYARGGRFENITEAYVGTRAKHQHKKTLCIYNEKVGTSTNTITGKRYSGCPSYYEQQVLDGTPLRKLYPENQWPFLLTNYKSNLQSSLSIAAERLRQIKPYNPVAINRKDAKRLKIESGDKVRISTPGGSVIALVQVRDGIIEGALGIEHGFGHTELGARTHQFGDKVITGRPALRAGINLNDIGLFDSSRTGKVPLSEVFVGGSVRQALPAKIEKI